MTIVTTYLESVAPNGRSAVFLRITSWRRREDLLDRFHTMNTGAPHVRCDAD
jgi:hypothetical protein